MDEAAELSRCYKPDTNNFLRRGAGIGGGATNPQLHEKNLGPFTSQQKDNSPSHIQRDRKTNFIKDDFASDDLANNPLANFDFVDLT